jgi:hypothetical protein
VLVILRPLRYIPIDHPRHASEDRVWWDGEGKRERMSVSLSAGQRVQRQCSWDW